MKPNDLLEEKPPKVERKKESSKAKAARMKRNQIEKGQGLDQQRSHVCEVCGNTYKYRHALEVHMRRHRGDKVRSLAEI
jgi:rubrerythrin